MKKDEWRHRRYSFFSFIRMMKNGGKRYTENERRHRRFPFSRPATFTSETQLVKH
jgi:hypothetical protein